MAVTLKGRLEVGKLLSGIQEQWHPAWHPGALHMARRLLMPLFYSLEQRGSGVRSRSEQGLGVGSYRVLSTKPKRVHPPTHQAKAGLIFRRSILR